MDDDFVPLEINNYLKQISEITVESETKHYLIIRGEKEKKEIEEEIKQLNKTKCELEEIKEKSLAELGKLKIKIYDLNEENQCVDELELEHRNSKKNEDAELWKLSQSVYSELISYCDNVQEFVENYQFHNIINEFLYPFSTKKVDSSKGEGVTEKMLQIDQLKAVEVQLKEQLDDLKNKHSFFMEELGKKAQLKHEPLEGKEFLELQGAITSCKEISKKLLGETSELEYKKNQKYFTKKIINCPVETSNNSKCGDNMKLPESKFHSAARNFNSALACAKTTNLNDSSNKFVTDKSDFEGKSSKTVTFVPKIGKRFKSANFK